MIKGKGRDVVFDTCDVQIYHLSNQESSNPSTRFRVVTIKPEIQNTTPINARIGLRECWSG